MKDYQNEIKRLKYILLDKNFVILNLVICTCSKQLRVNKHYQKYTKCQKYKFAHLIK